MWELAVSPFQPPGEMGISSMSFTGREGKGEAVANYMRQRELIATSQI